MGRKGKNAPAAAAAAAAAPTYVPKQIVKLDDLPPPVPVVTPPWVEEASGPAGPRDETVTESSSSPAADDVIAALDPETRTRLHRDGTLAQRLDTLAASGPVPPPARPRSLPARPQLMT